MASPVVLEQAFPACPRRAAGFHARDLLSRIFRGVVRRRASSTYTANGDTRRPSSAATQVWITHAQDWADTERKRSSAQWFDQLMALAGRGLFNATTYPDVYRT